MTVANFVPYLQLVKLITACSCKFDAEVSQQGVEGLA